MKRFINNGALNAVVRPQPFKMCALLSLLEASLVVRAGSRPLTLDQIIEISGFKPAQIQKGCISNDDMKWIGHECGMRVAIHDGELPDWETVKEYIVQNAVIYHQPGHYCLVVGFLEEPLILSSGPRPQVDTFKTAHWLVLADHRVKKPTDHLQGMLRTIRWDDVQQIILDNERAALLLVD